MERLYHAVLAAGMAPGGLEAALDDRLLRRREREWEAAARLIARG